MKFEKVCAFILIIVLIGIVLFILSIPANFIYTRFIIDKYYIQDDTLIYKSDVYELTNEFEPNIRLNVGKLLGTGFPRKRKTNDLIWPFWIYEYKNDKQHNRLFVRSLMFEAIYKKTSKSLSRED